MDQNVGGLRTKTVIELVDSSVQEIKADIEKLVLQHSAIERFNESGSGIFFSSGDHQWRPLDEQGRQLQSKILERYRRFFAVVSVLAKEQPARSLERLETSYGTILRVIEQDGGTWSRTSREELAGAVAALDEQRGVISDLYGGGAV